MRSNKILGMQLQYVHRDLKSDYTFSYSQTVLLSALEMLSASGSTAYSRAHHTDLGSGVPTQPRHARVVQLCMPDATRQDGTDVLTASNRKMTWKGK